MGWIKHDIQIDFPLPKIALNLIADLEEMDRNEDYAYYNFAEALDCLAKEMYVQGDITKAQWDLLCQKYDGL